MDFKELFNALYYCNRYVKEVPNPIYSKGRFYKKKKKIIDHLISKSNMEKYGVTYTIDSVENNPSSLSSNKVLIGMTIHVGEAMFQVHQEYDKDLKLIIGEISDDVPRREFCINEPDGILKDEEEFVKKMKIINQFYYYIKYPDNKDLQSAYVNAEYKFPRVSFSPVSHHKVIKLFSIDDDKNGFIFANKFIKCANSPDFTIEKLLK